MSLRLKINLLSGIILTTSISSICYAQIDLTDSDADGAPDAWEVAYGMNPSDQMDGAEDFDGDSIPNAQEFVIGTSPQLTDSDFDGVPDNVDLFPADRTKAVDSDLDGLPDSWEIRYGLDPYAEIGSQDDFDVDGLNSVQEYQLGTNPQSEDTDLDGVIDGEDLFPLLTGYARDTDSDGLPDKYEQQYFFLNELYSSDANDDFDGDSLSNITEFNLGTNPEDPDSDHDGSYDYEDPEPTSAEYSFDTDGDTMPDYWEMVQGTNPFSQDLWEDFDGDHLTNIAEYKAGTEANNPDTDNDGAEDGYDHYPLNFVYAYDMDRDVVVNHTGHINVVNCMPPLFDKEINHYCVGVA